MRRSETPAVPLCRELLAVKSSKGAGVERLHSVSSCTEYSQGVSRDKRVCPTLWGQTVRFYRPSVMSGRFL